jgi:hypothetical protein
VGYRAATERVLTAECGVHHSSGKAQHGNTEKQTVKQSKARRSTSQHSTARHSSV